VSAVPCVSGQCVSSVQCLSGQCVHSALCVMIAITRVICINFSYERLLVFLVE
jgi:hypothetical protein